MPEVPRPGPGEPTQRLEIDLEVSQEELERWQGFKEVFQDTVEGLPALLESGDRFSLHPLNFEFFAEEVEDPERLETLRKVVLRYAFEQLGFDPSKTQPFREYEDEEKRRVRIFPTNEEGIWLGYDGVDFWLELK
jgi:hypothetical protein